MEFKGSPVEKWYEVAPVDIEGMRSILHPEVEFHVCEGWPNGGSYHGIDAILDEFFPRASGSWETLKPHYDEVTEAGDSVVVRGRYVGSAAGTSIPFSVEFMHLWKVKDGLLIGMRQIADTVILADALAGRPR